MAQVFVCTYLLCLWLHLRIYTYHSLYTTSVRDVAMFPCFHCLLVSPGVAGALLLPVIFLLLLALLPGAPLPHLGSPGYQTRLQLVEKVVGGRGAG